MTNEEVLKIAYSTPKNKYIIQNLDDNTLLLIIEIMEQLDANDFKEINPNGEFEFDDIPIPYARLEKKDSPRQEVSKKIKDRLSEVLALINENGTNYEFPFLLESTESSSEYSILTPFTSGSSQNCTYDWKAIENRIKEASGKIKISILHTHPNPLDNQHKTLYNKYPDILSKLGVQPNGLNISLADVYAQQYLEMLVAKYGKDIETESTILMHDGKLISFETKNGLSLTSEQEIEKVNFETDYDWFKTE